MFSEFAYWAMAVVIIAIAFMLIFHRDVRDWIDRNKSLKLLGGLHAEGAEPVQQLEPPPVTRLPATEPTEQFLRPPRDPLCEPIESQEPNQIIASVSDNRFHLDRLCGYSPLRLSSETMSLFIGFIFGSQMSGLKRIAQYGDAANVERLREVSEQSPHSRWGYLLVRRVASLLDKPAVSRGGGRDHLQTNGSRVLLPSLAGD